MAEQTEPDLDSVIERLLEGNQKFSSCTIGLMLLSVRGSRPGKQVQLLEYEIRYLCTKAREIFINQPILLELEAPLKICGIQSFSMPVVIFRGHSRTVLRFVTFI